MIPRPPRSTRVRSSAASDVYKRQYQPNLLASAVAAKHKYKSSQRHHYDYHADQSPHGRGLHSNPEIGACTILIPSSLQSHHVVTGEGSFSGSEDGSDRSLFSSRNRVYYSRLELHFPVGWRSG